MIKNIKEYLRECYKVAKNSPDPSNQNGAIIIDENQEGTIVSRGCNEIVPGTEWTPEKIKDRDWKLFYVEHSERNAIYNLGKQGYKMEGLTMICPWFACSDCSKAILLNGIKRVIGHKERMDTTPERWKASVEAGLDLMRNGGVTLEFYSGKIDCDPILVNGEIWYP